MTTQVLFVCLGNICRSPMAEAIFNEQIKKLGLGHKVKAESCGTSGYHIGEEPDPRTMDILKAKGIQLSHKGRKMQKAFFNQYQYILVMDSQNLRDVLRLSQDPEDHQKVHKMRAFDAQAPHADVDDPWYGDRNDFEQCYQTLHRSIEGFIEQEKGKW